MTNRATTPRVPKRDVPHVSKEMLAYLERTYPEQSPRLSWSDREVWAKAGERTVVLHLKTIYEAQAKAALAGQ